MSFLAGVGSLVGGLSGLFGGGNQVPQYTPTISPTQLQTTSSEAGNAINPVSALTPLSSQNLGTAQGFVNQIVNNPYISQAQGGANTGAAYGAGAAANAYNYGTGLNATGTGLIGAGGSVMGMAPQYFGLAQQQIPYLNQTLQTAFDPQNALYNQQLALTQNQQNVQNSQSGVANTPYGASLADLNLQNFNTNWQNNLLQRQVLGAQGAGQLGSNIAGFNNVGTNFLNTGSGLVGQGAGLIGQGTGMQAGAPGIAAGSAALPYNFYNTNAGTGLSAIGQYQGLTGNAINQTNVPFNDYIALLGGLNQTNQVYNQGYQAQLAAQQQQFAQNAYYGQQIGAGLYGIGKGMPSMNLGFGQAGVG